MSLWGRGHSGTTLICSESVTTPSLRVLSYNGLRRTASTFFFTIITLEAQWLEEGCTILLRKNSFSSSLSCSFCCTGTRSCLPCFSSPIVFVFTVVCSESGEDMHLNTLSTFPPNYVAVYSLYGYISLSVSSPSLLGLLHCCLAPLQPIPDDRFYFILLMTFEDRCLFHPGGHYNAENIHNLSGRVK